MIDVLIELTAIFGAIFFIVILYRIGKRLAEFDFRKRQISEFSLYPEAADRFHISIVFFSLTQILFVVRLLSFYNLLDNLEISLSFIVPLLLFLTIPYFSLKRFRRTHIIIAVTGFTLMFLGGILFDIRLISINFYFGIISSFITASVLSAVLYELMKKKNVYAYTEFVIFFGVLIWDIVNGLALIDFRPFW